MDTADINSIWDIFLVPIYLTLILFIASSIKKKYILIYPEFKYFTWGLVAKCLGSIAFGLVYVYYYKGGDSLNYYHGISSLVKMSTHNFEVFWKITFPLSLPGVIGAILIIFIPTVGDYVTPALLGGTDGRMLSNMIQAYFGKINNMPLGAASATIMLTTVVLITIIVSNVTKRLTQRLN